MPSSFSASPLMWGVLALALLALAVLGVAYRGQRQRGRRLSASLEALSTVIDESEPGLLPGLVNAARFEQALAQATERCDNGLGAASVLFVNLDNFRQINDAYGIADGDWLIADVATRLQRLAGDAAVVSRVGGDEFLLLLPQAQLEASLQAACIVTALARPISLPCGAEIELGCSIGIACYPAHGARPRLVGNAALAMRHVKHAGGGSHMVYEPRMAVDRREEADLLRDLRQAVAQGQLELYYQPKVDAKTLQITAAEALLRWHHPRRGMVSPAVFVPLAERYGLIGAIGQWVIDDACRQAANWKARGLRMRVAINVSAVQMRQHDLVERLVAALQRHGLSPGRFTCEITETVAMEDTKVTQATFAKMRQAGLHVSIDDFGVGQTSLSYLRRLPAAELKIDASFVQEIDTSADARSIVDALLRMAHALGLRVVAEGVETEAQRDTLVHMGCDELQGYLFARPMTATALALWAMNDDAPATSDFSASLFQDTVPSA